MRSLLTMPNEPLLPLLTRVLSTGVVRAALVSGPLQLLTPEGKRSLVCSPKVGSKEKAKATTHTLQKALRGRLLVSVMPMNSGALHEDFGACTPIFQQLTEEREVFTCPSQEHAVPKCSRRLLLFRVKTLHLWNCNSLISLC